MWEHDQNSHGTHVTSVVVGCQCGAAAVDGVAPRATVVPAKVLGQSGSGWSSMVAAGIVYVTDLARVVINMSLGGLALDAVEQTAIDVAFLLAFRIHIFHSRHELLGHQDCATRRCS